MSTLQEQQWADQLQNARLQQGRKNNLPISAQLAHIAEELTFQKTRLNIALKTENQTDIDLRLNRLIDLRARATILTLLQSEKKQPLTPEIIEKEIKMYYTECSKLLTSVTLSH